MAAVRLLAVVNGKQRQIEVDFEQMASSSVLQRAITAEEITQGYVTLGKTPTNPSSVRFTWLGVPQYYSVDFTVTGDRLIFLPTFSDLLQAGDFIIVQY